MIGLFKKFQKQPESKYKIVKTEIPTSRMGDHPIPLDVGRAKIIHLPQLNYDDLFSREDDVDQDWELYYKHYNQGHSHYKRGWYQKAKSEFLRIYDLNHSSSAYHTHLLRSYRKIVGKLMEKKELEEAYSESQEMFSNCPNITNTDIKRYNKLVKLLEEKGSNLDLHEKELITEFEPEYVLGSERIQHVSDCKKPRGFKIPEVQGVNILWLKDLSDFVPTQLPHLSIGEKGLEYVQLESIPHINHEAYRFRESSNRNAFITNSTDLTIFVYDWNLKLLNRFNASKYSEAHTHLRRVDLSPNLEHYLFTNVDKAYILDSSFNIETSWEVPHQEGWKKVENGGITPISSIEYQQSLRVLGLKGKPSYEVIKYAYRKLAKKHHPDMNRDDPKTAEEKFKEISGAYEYLSGEDATTAFKGMENADYWVNTVNTIKFNVAGMTFQISVQVGSGEDWIYGSGFSENGLKIYLGCYSGKTYLVNASGIVEKIFVIPKVADEYKGRSVPVNYVLELGEFLYIVSFPAIFIIRNDETLKVIRDKRLKTKWFNNGFIRQSKNDISIFTSNGEEIGNVSFKNKIKHVIVNKDDLIIETRKMAHHFKISM